MEKGYYEIALNNLKFLEGSLHSSFYNDLGPMAEQVAEKMLKSVLELEAVDVLPALQSHNLKTINSKILEYGVDLHLSKKDLGNLKDVYFDARYPGENYVDVTKEDFEEYLETMYDVVDAVNSYRRNRGLPVEDIHRKSLSTLQPDTIDSVFKEYREKYNLLDESTWYIELGRLFELCKTTNIVEVANKIKELFL